MDAVERREQRVYQPLEGEAPPPLSIIPVDLLLGIFTFLGRKDL